MTSHIDILARQKTELEKVLVAVDETIEALDLSDAEKVKAVRARLKDTDVDAIRSLHKLMYA